MSNLKINFIPNIFGKLIFHFLIIFSFSIVVVAEETEQNTESAPKQAAKPQKEDLLLRVLNLPDLTHWHPEIFEGHTKYEAFFDEEGTAVLKAESDKSASGLVRKIEVDLTKTPYLNWSWKIENTLKNINETEESGDDYPARVYVVIDGGFFFWNTKAISYVWASDRAKGASWPNAFTSSAQMFAVQSGEYQAGKWIHEKRNLVEDFKKLFDIDAEKIDAIAIMTDTDNSKQSATAYYGDIFFTAQ